MQNILIVEDEHPISDLLKMVLTDRGYNCTCAYDGISGADLIEKNNYDLVLLDIMLPGIDGYELNNYCRMLKIPVIFLSAKSQVSDIVKGLKLGADDYIKKPFEIEELIARVENTLGRYASMEKELNFLDITINLESRIVTKKGIPVNLTSKEFDVLEIFARNINKVIYRDYLYSSVWESDYMGNSRTVDLHVQRMRKKLSLEKNIVPVYGHGYRLEVIE